MIENNVRAILSNQILSSQEYFHNRRLIDTYSDSLLFVNRLYQQKFGAETRKVPAHVPHMINKVVIEELQQRFQNEWQRTSSNKFRSSDDMQYAFSYYHYLMNRANILHKENFEIMDEVIFAGNQQKNNHNRLITTKSFLENETPKVIKWVM